MFDRRQAWDAEYSKPDPVWKGPAPENLSVEEGTVLELGCGNGKTAAALLRGGGAVVGVDFSRSALRACSASLSTDQLFLVQADVRCLPFADHAFDQVIAFHVLDHLSRTEREEAVSETVRVLRPGGRLQLRVFSPYDMRCGKGIQIEERTYLKGNGIPCHFFVAQEVRELLREFVTINLEEVVTKKRYGDRDLLRAELVGTFQLPFHAGK